MVDSHEKHLKNMVKTEALGWEILIFSAFRVG